MEDLIRMEELCDSDEQEGRLELIVPPYIESSYLLARDTPTKRLATQQQARS